MIEKIEIALYDHFRFTKNDVITNIYIDCFKHEHDCDLIVIRNKSLHALEVEIKMSVSDLKAERKKQRYQRRGVDYYHDSDVGMDKIFKEKWFAMPEKMKQKGLELIPDYAGLLIVNEYGGVKIARKAKKLNSQPLTQEQRTDIAFGCYELL